MGSWTSRFTPIPQSPLPIPHSRDQMIIGICGGTGSGKTTVARRILENVSDECVIFLQQDSYYRNLGDMPIELRHQINFDHPDALDNDLFINHVKALRAGGTVEASIYA